jgi:hypothetical protein
MGKNPVKSQLSPMKPSFFGEIPWKSQEFTIFHGENSGLGRI